ncbi:MAG: FKBP-type peptidyl-prolyl cis-trans isomerase [Erythrobacter sp.]
MNQTLLKLATCAACAAVGLANAPAHAQGEPAPEFIDGTAQDLGWHSAQQNYLLELRPADGWHFMERGLRWRWLEYTGSQERPSVADIVTVHYEGKLIDGTVFDSSYASGRPATFPLGRLVRGWQLAIPNMGVGDTIEIAIPADLAYGPRGRDPIPGGATLVFKVELINIGAE